MDRSRLLERDPNGGLGPHVRRRKQVKVSRISPALWALIAIAAIVVGAFTAAYAAPSPKPQVQPQPLDTQANIIVDGQSSDWTGVPPVAGNVGRIDNGEWIWNDLGSDERTDLSSPDTRIDFLEVRVTGNATSIFFLVRMTDIPAGAETGLGAPMVQFALDLDQTASSGQTLFAGSSDTRTAASGAANWEFLVQTRFGSGGTAGVLDTGFAFVGSALSAVDSSTDLIEVGASWTSLGTVLGPGPTKLRFTIASFKASAVADDTIDVGDSSVSDALDAVTTVGGNTWNEVLDQNVDYFFDVLFDSDGRVLQPAVINEVLPNPVGVEPDGEWIEIGNTMEYALNLSGWRITDTEGSWSFPAFAYVLPGDVAVIARSSGQFQTNHGFPPDYVYGSILLSNVGDDLTLRDATETVIDGMFYGTGANPECGPGAVVPPEGSSTERVAGQDTDDCSADFVVQSAPTPGTWLFVPELQSPLVLLALSLLMIFLTRAGRSRRAFLEKG